MNTPHEVRGGVKPSHLGLGLLLSGVLSLTAFAQTQDLSSIQVILERLGFSIPSATPTLQLQSGAAPRLAASSGGEPNFVYTQVTDTLPGHMPGGHSSAGALVVFASTANLDPSVGNTDGTWELFTFDRTSGVIEQLTNAPAPSANPALSADGTKVAFLSIANHVPGVGNADGSIEVFLLDLISGVIEQITQSTVEMGPPSISGNGSWVVFSSRGNLDPLGGNAEGVEEIFLYDRTSGTIRQVTNTTDGCSSNPEISADGSRVVFQSCSAELTPNPDHGVEIVTMNLDTFTLGPFLGTGSCPLAGGGSGSCTSRFPDISADGTKIAFSSNANFDPLNPSGGNPEEIFEFFLWDTTVPGAVTQVTNSPGIGAGTGGSSEVEMNADGTKFVFTSVADLVPGVGNSDGSEEVVLSESGVGLDQVTKTAAGGPDFSLPTVSPDGNAILFTTAWDLDPAPGGPGNPDGSEELFLAQWPNQAPVLDPIGPQNGTEGQLLSFNVSASDPDGTIPTLTADPSGLPVGHDAVFTDNGNGTGTFTWTPTFNDAPGPYTVTVTADDGELSDVEDVAISVAAATPSAGLFISALKRVAFASSSNRDRLSLLGAFTPSSGGDGINPSLEAVTVTVTDDEGDAFSQTLPPMVSFVTGTTGAFRFTASGAARFAPGIKSMRFTPLAHAPGSYGVAVRADRLDLGDVDAAPLTVTIASGDDTGTAAAPAPWFNNRRLILDFSMIPNRDTISFQGEFVSMSGLNPPAQQTTVTIVDDDGTTFQQVIPPGSFVAAPSGRSTYTQTGNPGITSLRFAPIPRSPGAYAVVLSASKLALAGLTTEPFFVELEVGGEIGMMIDFPVCRARLRLNGSIDGIGCPPLL